MILWKSKIKREAAEAYVDCGIRTWRRVLDIGWLSVSFHSEVKFRTDTPEESEWLWCQGTSISITKRFSLGTDHVYFDGPHCIYSVGFIHLCHEPDWCTKCMPDT